MGLLQGYSLIETLYQSGSTAVYRGTRAADGTPVICKLLSMEYPSAKDLSCFRREYEIGNKLQGKGTVKLCALEQVSNSLAIVMEDFGGEALSRSRSLAEAGIDEKLNIAAQIAAALAEIHRMNVIHKDINPANIVRNPQSGVVKIIDFGIATELPREAASFLDVGSLEGTLPYLSPEQTGRMNRPIDYRTDLYSLGVTLFELFTGELPFAGEDTLDFVYAHLAKRPPLPYQIRADIPEVIATIILKLLAKAPEDRYQSAFGVLNDVQRCARQLAETGSIASFAIGEADGTDKFTIPNRLYGRQAETATMQQALAESGESGPKLLLVAGAPGIGKTSLIQELHKTLAGRKGLLISGKFSQLEKNVPYSAVVQAFRDLVDQLLWAPADQRSACKAAILSSLGNNAGVLVDLVPKLSQLVGPQVAPSPLDPLAAHNRLQDVVRGFLAALASDTSPVVVFLDDLQWSDPPTLDLIKYLLGGQAVPGLLLVGAYRDNEVSDEHPLAVMLKGLDEKPAGTRPAYRKILVAPLGVEVVNRLVADTLRREPERTRALTAIVHGKTDGNPYFTSQMLTSLYARGAFAYNAAEDHWDWDMGQVARAELSDNVVEFLVQELGSLPGPAKAILDIAACVGNRFDLKTIALVQGESVADVGGHLWEAIEKEIVIPLSHDYRLLNLQDSDFDLSDVDIGFKFQHDRLLQAVQSTLGAQEKSRIHYRIGRELLKGLHASESGGMLFAIVNHLNLGRAWVQGRDERVELAELNAKAGRRAFAATAFKSAAEYFDTAVSLVACDDAWHAMPTKRFPLCLQHAESVFLAGDLSKADAMTGPLFELAAGDIERASVHNLRSRILEFRCDLHGAIDEIRKSLRPLGIVLPEDKDEIERRVGEGLGRMQQAFAGMRMEDLLALPEMKDPEKVTAMRLLAQVVPAAIQSNYPLYLIATMTMADLTLSHGITAESCKCIADCGIMYSAVLDQLETGYQLGKVAFALMERLKVDWQKPAVCFSFSYVSHMRKHYREALDAYEMSYRSGIAVGDLQHATYARAHKVHLMTWVGASLQECKREAESTIAFLEQSQGFLQLMLANIVLHAIRKLQAAPHEQEALAKVDGEIMSRLEHMHHVVLIERMSQYGELLCFILGDMDEAERWSDKAEALKFVAGTDFPLVDHELVRALLCLDKLKRNLAPDPAATLAKVEAGLARLKKVAENCPENFAHKLHLLSAELAAFKGAPLETVVGHYQRALASIGKGDFCQMVALINELQGKFWLARNNDTIAKAFLREAYYHYGQWGASRKTEAMERQYRDVFVLREESAATTMPPHKTHKTPKTHGSSHSVSNAALDITSIVKSSQAISSEIRTEKLLRTLLQTMLENAGAQSGCLLLVGRNAPHLGVVASRQGENEAVEIMEALPFWQSPHLCREVVEYVERTRESVVLDNAAVESRFSDNDYVQRHKIKSVLCMPVIHQNALKGVVYMENNLSDHVFTTERLSVLSILASQASISIENAQLYADMESKVRERTTLLHQANDKLKQLALIDPLTRLNNRRYFHDHITGVTESYIRKLNRCMSGTENRNLSLDQAVLGVFLVDIDNFKEVNDTWGHAAGDAVLVAIAAMLKSIIRSDDFIVRWGGEEFLVILNNTSPAYLDRFACKVLRATSETVIEVAEGTAIRRTCSIGYTQIPFWRSLPDFLTLEQTIKLSDYAMYVAKASGRNRAVHISIREGHEPDAALKNSLMSLSGNLAAESERIQLRHVTASAAD